MYWLCFYNGFDVPEVEAAFLSDFMLVEYAQHFIASDPSRTSCYFVFLPSKSAVIPLDKFLSTHKEA